jgi:hypothetical protein
MISPAASNSEILNAGVQISSSSVHLLDKRSAFLLQLALCRLSLLGQSASSIPYRESTMKKSLSKLTYKALTGKEAPSFYDSKRAHQNQQLGPRNY